VTNRVTNQQFLGRAIAVLSRFMVDMSAPVAVFQFGDWLR